MKKRNRIFLLVLVLLVALVALSACGNEKVDLDEYMNDGANGINNLSLVGKLVATLHSWIGNYGLTVIVFTVLLKLVMLPLDFYQRYTMRKSSLKMQELQPIIEEIDRAYGKNPQKAQEEKRKLYKQQSVSSLSSCLPMIVTMLVFIFMFRGLTNYATYNSVTNYDKLNKFYDGEYDYAKAYAISIGIDEDEIDEYAKILASQGNYDQEGNLVTLEGREYIGIGQYYLTDVKESFLWINNIWQPDTWVSIMPTYETFTKTVSINDPLAKVQYDLIREQVLLTHQPAVGDIGSWNGLIILPVLSVVLSFLSIYITQKLDKKNKKGEEVQANAQQAASNKVMMFMMPAMMAFFGFIYTGAFAIYITVSYVMSIFTTVVMKKLVDKKIEKNISNNPINKNQPPKANYMR